MKLAFTIGNRYNSPKDVGEQGRTNRDAAT